MLNKSIMATKEIWKYQDQEHIPQEILSKMSDDELLDFVEQERHEWEASQGPNFQVPEDSERQESIKERLENLLKQKATAKNRDRISSVLKKAA
jgi:serine phosphatase RsbU (regulator of sigma subunit)